MSHKEYRTVKHPRSGEVYAVELNVLTGEDETDTIDVLLTRVAGPLYLGSGERDCDPLNPRSICDYLDNQDDQDCRADAIWLRREIERATR